MRARVFPALTVVVVALLAGFASGCSSHPASGKISVRPGSFDVSSTAAKGDIAISIRIQSSDLANGQPIALTVTYHNMSSTTTQTVVSDHNYLFNWWITTQTGRLAMNDPSQLKSGAGLPETMVLAPGQSRAQTFSVQMLPSGVYEAHTGNDPSPTVDVPPVHFTIP